MKSEELITKLKNNEIPDGTKLEARGYNGNLVIDNYGHLRLDKEYYETLDGIRHPLSLYCVVDMLTNPNTDFKIVSGQASKYYRLIDILNKIANGELKEGTKFMYRNNMHKYRDGLLLNTSNLEPFDIADRADLNMELQLIEPDDFADDGKMAENTDNTKIEELRYSDFWEWDDWVEGTDEEEFVGVEKATKILFDKLNEVIRKLNKEDNNE